MSEPTNSALRQEYMARINRVIDYIEKNLDHPLRLDELANVAHFSPYHFHRIFGALMQESLNQFIKRLRIEKAADFLINHPRKSITEIALDCGFSGSAPFARAFKDTFGMSASEWRAGGYLNDRKIDQTDHNNNQADDKIGEAFVISSDYLGNTKSQITWRITMKGESKFKADVRVEQLDEIHVAYVRHVGPYKGDATLFEGLFTRLFQWAGPRGLASAPDAQVLAVYHDNPEITDEDKLRVSVCISVPADTSVDGDIGKMTLQVGKFAIAKFELANDEYEQAWNAVYGGWLPESGYQPDDGPCFERYLNDPKTHPEGKCIVEICVPVKPM